MTRLAPAALRGGRALVQLGRGGRVRHAWLGLGLGLGLRLGLGLGLGLELGLG